MVKERRKRPGRAGLGAVACVGRGSGVGEADGAEVRPALAPREPEAATCEKPLSGRAQTLIFPEGGARRPRRSHSSTG